MPKRKKSGNHSVSKGERPNVNKKIGKREIFFSLKSSFNELPDIYDI